MVDLSLVLFVLLSAEDTAFIVLSRKDLQKTFGLFSFTLQKMETYHKYRYDICIVLFCLGLGGGCFRGNVLLVGWGFFWFIFIYLFIFRGGVTSEVNIYF